MKDFIKDFVKKFLLFVLGAFILSIALLKLTNPIIMFLVEISLGAYTGVVLLQRYIDSLVNNNLVNMEVLNDE